MARRTAGRAVNSRSGEQKKARVYRMTRIEELGAIASGRRQPIIDLLAASGPLSAREIARNIGLKPSAIYFHLEQLMQVGLVVERGSRKAGRRTEQLFDTVATRMRIGVAPGSDDSAEIWEQLHLSQSRQTDRDFVSGLTMSDAIGEGSQRNLRTFRVIGSPNPDQLARVNALLDEALDILWESAGGDGPLVSLSAVVAPLPSSKD